MHEEIEDSHGFSWIDLQEMPKARFNVSCVRTTKVSFHFGCVESCDVVRVKGRKKSSDDGLKLMGTYLAHLLCEFPFQNPAAFQGFLDEPFLDNQVRFRHQVESAAELHLLFR